VGTADLVGGLHGRNYADVYLIWHFVFCVYRSLSAIHRGEIREAVAGVYT